MRDTHSDRHTVRHTQCFEIVGQGERQAINYCPWLHWGLFLETFLTPVEKVSQLDTLKELRALFFISNRFNLGSDPRKVKQFLRLRYNLLLSIVFTLFHWFIGRWNHMYAILSYFEPNIRKKISNWWSWCLSHVACRKNVNHSISQRTLYTLFYKNTFIRRSRLKIAKN